MEIRNSSKRTLVIYIGWKDNEEPEMVKTLLVGEGFDVEENVANLISIQEQ